MSFNDYIFKFPVSGLALALTALPVFLTAEHIKIGTMGLRLQNCLGDPRDNTGAIVSPLNATWMGRQGFAPGSDPTQYYLAIRTPVTLPDLGAFNPTAYGVTVAAAAESAACLGVWA